LLRINTIELEIKEERRRFDPSYRYHKVGGNTSRFQDPAFVSDPPQVLGAEDILPLEICDNLNKHDRWETVIAYLLELGYLERTPHNGPVRDTSNEYTGGARPKLYSNRTIYEWASGNQAGRERRGERWFYHPDKPEKLVRLTSPEESARNKRMTVETHSWPWHIKRMMGTEPRCRAQRKAALKQERTASDYDDDEPVFDEPYEPCTRREVSSDQTLAAYIEPELFKVEWEILDDPDVLEWLLA
jgi:hypothetical protein